MLKLISPTIKYKEEYITSERESARKGEVRLSTIKKIEKDFKKYLEDMYFTKKLKRGQVPSISYWLMDDSRLLGGVTIRWNLNARLRREGGHVGYGIRPSERKKGYGTKILAMALRKMKKMGVKKALVTCDDTNVGSWKIIEANGGILENKIIIKGRKIRRYYIKVK